MNLPEKEPFRAVNYMLTKEEKIKQEKELHNSSEPNFAEMLYSSERDGVLLRLFGDIPDYSNPEIELIWDEVLEAEPRKMFNYSLRRGIDLLDNDGVPVPPWRDIVVMLKCIDKGLLNVA